MAITKSKKVTLTSSGATLEADTIDVVFLGFTVVNTHGSTASVVEVVDGSDDTIAVLLNTATTQTITPDWLTRVPATGLGLTLPTGPTSVTVIITYELPTDEDDRDDIETGVTGRTSNSTRATSSRTARGPDKFTQRTSAGGPGLL